MMIIKWLLLTLILGYVVISMVWFTKMVFYYFSLVRLERKLKKQWLNDQEFKKFVEMMAKQVEEEKEDGESI